ncbi:dTDP-4-dehydrorhamnose 3,5-epimerase family protein [Amycolatopsis plumensis]
MESRIERLPISGSWKVSPSAFTDERGSVHEYFHSGQFAAAASVSLAVRQATCSVSHRSVLRGIRVTAAGGPAKYVTCLRGAVLDVIVDLRVGSPTFGRSHAERLDEGNRNAVYLAPGLGHAFLALSDDATLLYLLSQPHSDAHERAVNPLDPDLAIAWPSDITPRLAAKDANAPGMSEARQAGILPSYLSCLPLHGATAPQAS